MVIKNFLAVNGNFVFRYLTLKPVKNTLIDKARNSKPYGYRTKTHAVRPRTRFDARVGKDCELK
jgi:hypothetical protein